MDLKQIEHIYPRMGNDEVGKGDFFGPLVACSVYLERPDQVTDSRIVDSKRLSDSRVLQLAAELKKQLQYSVVKILPKKYNELYGKFKNINIILGWAHAQAVLNLVEKGLSAKVVTIDKFGPEFRVLNHFKDGGLKKKTHFFTKAESDYAVAAASIIARAAFLEEMSGLSKKAGLKIPFGAGELVDAAAGKLAARIGKANLSEFVKLHFKNFAKI